MPSRVFPESIALPLTLPFNSILMMIFYTISHVVFMRPGLALRFVA